MKGTGKILHANNRYLILCCSTMMDFGKKEGSYEIF